MLLEAISTYSENLHLKNGKLPFHRCMESSCSKLNYLRKWDEEVALVCFAQLCVHLQLCPAPG